MRRPRVMRTSTRVPPRSLFSTRTEPFAKPLDGDSDIRRVLLQILVPRQYRAADAGQICLQSMSVPQLCRLTCVYPQFAATSVTHAHFVRLVICVGLGAQDQSMFFVVL